MKYTKKTLRLFAITIFAITITVAISLLLKTITKHYVLVMGILAFLIKVFYPQLRGYMGEFWVKIELKKLPKDKYIVLNNIMLKNNNNTYQIDHIVVSNYGIFVIEMKNYYGLIVGDEYKESWIQYLGKTKSYFKNPIHQNYGHVKALEELLNLDNKLFIPIVCFSNQVKLKVSSKSIITKLDYLIRIIKRFELIQINSDINEIADKIRILNIKDKNERKNHVKNIKQNIVQKDIKINNMICPKCGGKLIQRNSKYGIFLGCSNYPKCKFTKSNLRK